MPGPIPGSSGLTPFACRLLKDEAVLFTASRMLGLVGFTPGAGGLPKSTRESPCGMRSGWNQCRTVVAT